KVGKKILEKIISGDSRLAYTIIQEEGLRQLNDINEIEKICQEVILQNPKQLKSLREGKQTVFAWFVGQVMNKTKGQANPKLRKHKEDPGLKTMVKDFVRKW
ncbi:721_t:CDS:2, partial [Dentiscutata heterogama]